MEAMQEVNYFLTLHINPYPYAVTKGVTQVKNLLMLYN